MPSLAAESSQLQWRERSRQLPPPCATLSALGTQERERDRQRERERESVCVCVCVMPQPGRGEQGREASKEKREVNAPLGSTGPVMAWCKKVSSSSTWLL